MQIILHYLKTKEVFVSRVTQIYHMFLVTTLLKSVRKLKEATRYIKVFLLKNHSRHLLLQELQLEAQRHEKQSSTSVKPMNLLQDYNSKQSKEIKQKHGKELEIHNQGRSYK